MFAASSERAATWTAATLLVVILTAAMGQRVLVMAMPTETTARAMTRLEGVGVQMAEAMETTKAEEMVARWPRP